MDLDNAATTVGDVDKNIRTFLKDVYLSLDEGNPSSVHSALDSIVILMGLASNDEQNEGGNPRTRYPSSSESGWGLIFQHFPTTLDRRLASDSFLKNHYSRFADLLLDKLTLDWVDKHNKTKLNISLLSIFLHRNYAAQSFMVLLRHITASSSSPGYQVNKCVSLLEQFLKEHRLVDIIWKECIVDNQRSKDHFHEELIRAIVSLPNKTANKLKDQNSLLFYPESYISLLSQDLLKVLHNVHDSLKNSADCSLQFVCQLFSSICYSGCAGTLWNGILPEILKNIKTNFIWCRICKRLVVGSPDRKIESLLIPLLTKLPWYGLVEIFLGDAVVEIPKVKYLLSTKVLLHRFFEKDLLLQNILGYLASSPNRRPLFIQVFKTLINVWGDASALRHTSYEQHHYISRAIIICAGFITEKDEEEHKKAAASSLMYGMENHLQNIDSNIHTLGMAVTELLVKKLNPNGPELKFTYEKSQQIKDLQELIHPPQEPSEHWLVDVPALPLIKQETEKEPKIIQENPQSKDCELDSDDDEFEPYDMSNDKQISKVKTPKYLRDCMEGLINTEDIDRVEVCLSVAEDLIRSNPYGLQEVAIEFSQILLHLTNISSCTDFIESRFRALVAITVLCPIEATTYLTEQVYARNYNIRQRLDILEVLGAAAMELAKPNAQKSKSGSSETVSQTDVNVQLIQPEKKVYNWQEIVQKRIDSKTRRFAKGRTIPEPQAVPNRFSSVAGYFFYPLLKNYDNKDTSVDILAEDPVILERLLYTLGIILYSAINTMAVKQMGKCLFDFIWALRYHPESSVCQALLFGVSMVYLSVPSHILLGEMQQDTMEFKEWLQDIIEKEPHAECQKLAAQTLMILQKIIQKEF